MPKINRYLQNLLYAGEGSGDGSIISLNKVPFFGPSCSTGGWYDEDHLACQYYNENQHPIFILINRNTKEQTLILNEGAMGIVTGGGRWFAQTLTQYLLDGAPTDRHAYAFGLDGTLVWHPFSGLGLYIEDLQITPNQVNDVTYMENNQVVYIENGRIKSNIPGAENIVSLGLPGEFGNLVAYWWNSNLWVMYQWYTTNSIVTHPYDNYNGYLLGNGNCYGPDAFVFDGEPAFVWSVSPAFQAEQLVEVTELGELFDLRTLGEDVEDPMKVPAVTVDKWTLKNMNDGGEFIFHDRENLDLGYKIRVHIRGGGIYAEITNAAGFASTGAFRPVEKCPESPTIPPIEPPVEPPPTGNASIQLNGKFFKRENGDRMTVIQSSEFSMFKRYLDNDNPTLDPVLMQRRDLGFNTFRVWLLNESVVAWRNGVKQDMIHPNQYSNFYTKLTSFVDMLGAMGFCVELTVFTSCGAIMPDRDEQQRHLTNTANAVRGRKNVIIELTNEADQYDNAPHPDLIRPTGVIVSHGSNGADNLGVTPMWDYTLYHTNDLVEFQRKVGHNAMEIADEYNIPCVSNENTRYPDRDSSENHAYDAAAGGALLCAGSCFHSQGGKFSRGFDDVELRCARKWIEGAKSVPTEFQTGAYARHDNMNGPNVIRAYSRTLPDGRSHLVLIRP